MKNEQTIEPQLFNREEVAEYLGMSPRSFDRHVRRQLPSIQLGSLRRWRKEEVDRFLTALNDDTA